MATSYENTPYENAPVESAVVQPGYSSFWPLAILIGGLILWTGYQAWGAYSQESAISQSLVAAQTTIHAAEEAQGKLYSLAQDLVQTSSKDTYAAQVVREARIQIRPNANTGEAATAPSP